MWTSTVGLVNGKHRYLTAETFGFKVNSNGQQLKRRQQWTIEPFPENTGPDGSISSAASVSSQCPSQTHANVNNPLQQALDSNDPCILTLGGVLSGGGATAGGALAVAASLSSIKSSSQGSSGGSEQEACGEEHENVAIRSHLNKYLAVDSFGNVTCDSDEKTETARFTITICSMSQGRSKEEHIFWAFKNVERGYYLGTTDDGMICCNAKMPKSRAELWHLHLLPARGASFFAIKSLGRKRFARITPIEAAAGGASNATAAHNHQAERQVQLDANISWGAETLFQFKYHEGGRYSLLTSDNKLLTNEGKCIEWAGGGGSGEVAVEGGGGAVAQPLPLLPPAECLFTLEYHSGYLAFRDSFGQYLAAAGRSSVLRSRSIGVSRDELFVFESVPIQVSLKATFNNRWVSIKQGVDLSANQMETSSRFETFQLTYHKQTHNWSIMTHECNFWTISQNTNTVSVCRPGDYEGLTRGQFKLAWSDSDATFSLKYVDLNQLERWICARKSGQLFVGAGEPVKFVMRFQNRRHLNLRPVEGSGFVGLRCGVSSKQIEANKTTPDTLLVEYSELSNGALSNGQRALFEQTTTAAAGAAGQRDEHVLTGSNEHKVINVFNVKLNNTRMGASVFERNANGAQLHAARREEAAAGAIEGAQQQQQQKEIDCGIDANNNCMDPCDDLEAAAAASAGLNGGVESAAAPSVASIISSFSSARINNGNKAEQLASEAASVEHKSSQRVVGSAISKLASSFENGTAPATTAASNGRPQADGDTASVVSSGSSSASSTNATAVQLECHGGGQLLSKGAGLAEQVAQSECCYMKLLASGKYLAAGAGPEASVLCDATNRACAQAWILELRSHNSIAIRASDTQAYLQLGTNGTIQLARCEPQEASLWEF